MATTIQLVNSIIELIESFSRSDIIAALAFFVSIYSTYISRATLISSKRPFVWGVNYSVLGKIPNTIIPVPHKLMLRVSNAPAQVIMLSFSVKIDNTVLQEYTETDSVQFPDSGSEWTFNISEDDYKRIIEEVDKNAGVVSRNIVIRYKAIDGRSIYKYELHQKFDKSENQWRKIKEVSN